MSSHHLAPVVDEVRHHRFLIEQAGEISELVYRRTGDRLVLLHTRVPKALRAQGIGGRLVRTALETTAKEGLTVLSSCPFVDRWARRHPDLAATVNFEHTVAAGHGPS